MGKLIRALATFFCLSLTAEQQEGSRFEWVSNYEDAIEQSRATSKPVVLFFTGSDWCGWCHKLEKEVLNTPEFASLAGGEFIFVTLDFPLYKPTDPKVTETNKRLQKKFDVKGFPTLVIIDKNEQQIGTVGYRPGGAKAYAEHLIQMVKDYNQYRQKVGEAEGRNLSSTDLKSLYQKASELGQGEEAAKLVALGIKSDEKIYFLLERFRALALEGHINTSQAQTVKREIQSLDPNNEKETQYEIAVIEFESFSEDMARDLATPEFAVAPLIQYIQKYGKRDKTNVWKLQMAISQVYLEKNKYQQALDHARASYDTAPDQVKSDIEIAVKNIQSALKK